MASSIVLTSCTSRKRGGALPLSLQECDQDASLEQIAEAWRIALQAVQPSHQVRDLYLGRTFSCAYRATRAIDGDLFVASAGLGLVHELDDAPCYDLTFADPTNPLAKLLASRGVTSRHWWMALRSVNIGRGSLLQAMESSDPDCILIALPSGYLDMITQDIQELPEEVTERVRIFTSSTGLSSLPTDLRHLVMPYDDRLESVPHYSGTRTDFPQRALLHFVTELDGHRLEWSAGAEAVSQSLTGLSTRHIPTRCRLDDSEIANLLRRHWRDYGGSSTRLLRFLRREAQIACEQGRFRDIWRGLKAEMKSAEGRT